MSFFKVENLSYTYDKKSLPVLGGLTFDLAPKERLSIIGPSGAGKSTLAMVLAGVKRPQGGKFTFQGMEIFSGEVSSSKELFKGISYVSQEEELDPKLPLFEQLSMPLKNLNEQEVHHHVRYFIEVFGLPYKDNLLPHQLSTGQRKRALLAKALITGPALLILDEPFAHLDKFLRNELQDELFEYLENKDIAVITITHSLEDSLERSDRILVLGESKIKQLASPQEIYNHPKNAFVASYTGRVNLIPSKVQQREGEILSIENPLGEFKAFYRGNIEDNENVYMFLRPEHLKISSQKGWRGKITKIKYLGAYREIYLKGPLLDKHPPLVLWDFSSEPYQVGKTVNFELNNHHLVAIPL